MRRWLMIGLTAAVVAAVVIGLTQTSSQDTTPSSAAPSAPSAARLLAGSPPALAALHARANQLLGGGRAALRTQLAALKGHPVVINKWASWCGPCRAEFPIFQRISAKFGKRVAFFGLNSGDNHDDARNFLARFPVSYPSFEDPRERTAVSLGAGTAYPITLFYDAKGERQYIHQGGYATEAKLVEDLQRYLLSGS